LLFSLISTMSAAASQVILHPNVTQSLKILSTTLGRDKLYRAIQYFSRFLAWFLIRRGFADEGGRWDALKAALASGRKLLRLGKPVEHLQSALKSTQLKATTGEKITTIGRQLGYAGYLLFDGIVWAHSVRFLRLTPDRAQKYTKLSLRLWLSGILFSFAQGMLKAGRLANEAKALRSAPKEKSSVGGTAESGSLIRSLQAQREAVRAQFLLDILDVWLPASSLGYVHLNDGIVGLLGFTTSLISLNSQWASLRTKTN